MLLILQSARVLANYRAREGGPLDLPSLPKIGTTLVNHRQMSWRALCSRSGVGHGMRSPSLGSVNSKTVPWGWFGVARSRPPWAAIIERLIANPMPMPSGLVE